MPRLSARWVLPIDSPPIADGAIDIEDGVIVAIGRRSGAVTRDFGDAILMPGLINAHTHLEYTLLRGFLEDAPFFEWIRALVALKGRLTTDEWDVSARLGAAECLASGITTVGDNADAGVTAAAAAQSGLRGVVFQEVSWRA